MFLSKSISKSEMDIYQILRLNFYKKLGKWWTEDVDGDCIIFNLYRNTENSIVLLKRWREDFRKEEYCQTYQQGFCLEELTQIDWSISKKRTMVELVEQKLKTRNIILITVLSLIQTQNLYLSDYLLIDYPNSKNFRLFILPYTKKKRRKTNILVTSLFIG